MSTIQEHNEILELNNTDLTDILDAINTLPTLSLQDKTVTPTTEEQIIQADDGYHGLSNVTIEAIQDENLIAENIKDGVEILGVTGNFIGGKYKPTFIRFDNYRGSSLNYEIANLDTSNMSDMSSMFNTCSYVLTLDLSGFDTSNVTNMQRMFYQCMKLNNLNISNFNTNNVTNMSYMFYYCQELSTLDLHHFNTSKVTNMSYMFNTCTKLETLDLNNFNTEQVTQMASMFAKSEFLTTLDLSSFDVSKVTNMGNMFQNCYRLTKLIINNPNVFTLKQTNVFTNTPIAGYTNYTDGELGYVYVPDDLVETYKTAQVWSTYASQIKGISELPQE